MSDDDKVVFLAYKSGTVASDMMAFLACCHCKNKTFTLTEDKLHTFPLMRCAACGCHIGRMGWWHEDKLGTP